MKKSVAQEEKLGFIAQSVFLLEKIEMKKDFIWRLKLKMKTILPQSYREYDVKLTLNEEPYEVRIEDLEKKRYEVETDTQGDMFEGRKTQLKNIDQEIKEVRKELEQALKDSSVRL
jgi:hypothetical protein